MTKITRIFDLTDTSKYQMFIFFHTYSELIYVYVYDEYVDRRIDISIVIIYYVKDDKRCK